MTEPSVQSVDRALLILERLAEQGPLSVGDLASYLGTHKSTASRLLATLAQRGYVEQETARGRYHLGVGVMRLASTFGANLDLLRLARPICRALSEATQETVNISVLEQDEVINIDQVIGPSSVVSINWTGRRNPLNCTSTGKVLLAYASSEEQYRLFRKPLKRCTGHSILKFELLEKQLQDIKEQGYAATFEELELGMNAVAAPIWSYADEVVAALSISGPSYRMTKARIRELGEAVKAAGLEVSERLGWQQKT